MVDKIFVDQQQECVLKEQLFGFVPMLIEGNFSEHDFLFRQGGK